jgi:transposase-like protein
MRAYSEDLRKKKIVAAIEQRGMSKAEAARTFDVSLSSVSSDTLGVSDRESPSRPRRALDEPAR